MSFILVQSHRLDTLMSCLVEQHFQSTVTLSQILCPQHIIVPNPAIKYWLTQQLAKQTSICANIYWHKNINEFQWFIFQQSSDQKEYIRQANLPRLVMKWQIYQCLLPYIRLENNQINAEHVLYPVIQNIYDQTNHFLSAEDRLLKRQSMLYWISEHVSRAFRHYMQYRPQWLSKWSLNKQVDMQALLPILDQDQQKEQRIYHSLTIEEKLLHVDQFQLHYAKELEQWQRALWFYLFAEHYQEMQQIERDFWKRCQEQQHQMASNLPKKVIIFTILDLTPQQLTFLKRLGNLIDVYLFHFNATQEYWADSVDPRWKQQQDLKIKQRITYKFPEFSEQEFQEYFESLQQGFHPELREARHPLLTRFGKQARDHFSILAESAGGEDQSEWYDLFYHLDAKGQYHEPSFPQTLLGRLQEDIFYLVNPPQHQYDLDLTDRSIQFHVCHSLLRQIEVLKEQLLHWLAESTEKQPRTPQDILICVPDLENIEPLIRGVFSSDQQTLPIQITGSIPLQLQAVWDSLVYRITWPRSRFSLDEFADWLQLPATQLYYQLDEISTERLITLLNRAGFKRGFDPIHLQQSLDQQDQDYRFTFKYALDRLAMGIAIPEHCLCDTGQETIVSTDVVIAQDMELVSCLLNIYQDFVDRRDWLNPSKSSVYHRTTAMWLAILLDEVKSYQQQGVPYTEQIYQMIKQQDTMLSLTYNVKQTVKRKGFDLKHFSLPLWEILQEIQRQLTHQYDDAEPSGAITVCQIGRIRPIPYQLMILLNMDSGVFPARDTHVAFDLLHIVKQQLGDRARLDDHQGAFLDSILLAQQQLWLFYTGVDEESNEVIEPSTVVIEFIQHLAYLVALPKSDDAPQRVNIQGIPIIKSLSSLYYIHPNQPFKLQGFQPSQYPLRFEDHWFSVAKQFAQSFQSRTPYWRDCELISSTTEPIRLDAQQWIKQVSFPALVYLRQLHVNNRRRDQQHENIEPLFLNKLEEYQLGERLLQQVWNTESDLTEDYRLYSPMLPIGKMQHSVWKKLVDQQQDLKSLCTQFSISYTPVTQQDYHVTPELTLQILVPKERQCQHWGSIYLNKKRGKYQLRAWLQHLCWLAWLDLEDQGQEYSSYHVLQNAILQTTGISSNQAKYYLEQWMKAWHTAQHNPLVLTAGMILDNDISQKDFVDQQLTESAIEKIKKEWFQTYDKKNIPNQENEKRFLHQDWHFILQDKTHAEEKLLQSLQQFGFLYDPIYQYQTDLLTK